MYQYNICPPKIKNGFRLYHTYSSLIIKNYLDKSPEWEVTKDKKNVHFSDCPSAKRIKYYLPIKKYIYYKHILASILYNSDFHPTTFIISNGKITDKRYNAMVNSQDKGKWFLKPATGGGGKGIQVLSRLSNWKNCVHPRKKYVIQKGIESICYKGRKFDLRTYILIVTTKKKVHAYISKESCMRVSNCKYNSKSLRNDINVTNVSFQNSTKNKKLLNSVSFRGWEHYDKVQPKMKKIVTQFITKILPLIKKRPSVALLGCDFLVDKNLRPHFLEINNKIGFGMGSRLPKDAQTVREMIYDIFEIGYKPIIHSYLPPEESKEWDKCF